MLSGSEKIEAQRVAKGLINEELSEHATKIGSMNTVRKVLRRLRRNRKGVLSERVYKSNRSEIETISCDIQEVVDMELEEIGKSSGYVVVRVGEHTNLYKSKKDMNILIMQELVVRDIIIVGIVSAIMWLVCK